MGALDGKVAVITGSTRGFGLAMARGFAREGARVVVCSRSEDAVQTTVDQLKASGAMVSGRACDVSHLDQVQTLAQHALERFEQLDIWVNNAAISAPYGPVLKIDPGTFRTVTETNIFSSYYGSLVALKIFIQQGHGKLINILGRGDRQPTPMQVPYSASKAWQRSFTTSLAKETKSSGVGVYAYNPGMMDTDMLQEVEVIRGYEERLRPMETIMRMWSHPPEEAVDKAIWLASSATDGRTGLILRYMTPWKMMGGTLGELFRRITGRSGRPVRVTLHPVDGDEG